CYTEYGMRRTGCVGCPYSPKISEELEIIQKYEPKLYKAAVAVLLCVGHSNLKKVVKYCNSIGSPETAYFNFGTTASGGIGLTFNF
ncbi:MAG: hypothetical protein IIZ90_05070, partial [Bacteroidales bacterium]|nr:hypothetical protein [Bacteroidales bacterium]